jgi:hypothetical protein
MTNTCKSRLRPRLLGGGKSKTGRNTSINRGVTGCRS